MRTLVFLGLITFSAAISMSATNEIHMINIQTQSAVGRLGKPLGSRTVIVGTQAAKPVMLANPFDVAEVDGRTMTNIVTIEIRGEVRIQPGIRYTLEGYESGGFEGDPEWLNPEVQSPFQFRSFFVVTKVVKSGPK